MASEAQPSATRVHRFIVPILRVLATLVGTAATFAVWVHGRR